MSPLPEVPPYSKHSKEVKAKMAIYIAEAGQGDKFLYSKPTDATLTTANAAAKTALNTIGAKQLGVLSDKVKSGRKKGSVKTTEGTSHLFETSFTVVNASVEHIKLARLVHGGVFDIIQHDELNGRIKIFEKQTLETEENEEHDKQGEIPYKGTSDTFNPDDCVVWDLLTGTTTAV